LGQANIRLSLWNTVLTPHSTALTCTQWIDVSRVLDDVCTPTVSLPPPCNFPAAPITIYARSCPLIRIERSYHLPGGGSAPHQVSAPAQRFDQFRVGLVAAPLVTVHPACAVFGSRCPPFHGQTLPGVGVWNLRFGAAGKLGRACAANPFLWHLR